MTSNGKKASKCLAKQEERKMLLMELRLFGAKAAGDDDTASATPLSILARKLAGAVKAYAEAVTMARSAPFDLYRPRRAALERPPRKYGE